MNRSVIIRTVLVALLGITLAIVSQSARLLQQLEAQGVNVQYSTGSPLSGRAFVHVQQQWQPVWFALSWQWCPRLNPARWCINADSDIGQANGVLSLGFNSLTLSDTDINTENIPLILAGFVDANTRIEGHIHTLSIHNEIYLNAIKAIDATVLFSDINAAGFAFKPHRIQATGSAKEDFQLTINGEEANGKVSATAAGKYSANIALTPASDVAALLKNQFPEAPDGTFTLTHSGVLAVPQ